MQCAGHQVWAVTVTREQARVRCSLSAALLVLLCSQRTTVNDTAAEP